MTGVVHPSPWAGLSSMSKWELLFGGRQQFKQTDFYYSLCNRAVIRHKLFLPQEEEEKKKRPLLLPFPYTPKPNEQKGFHLPALASFCCYTCFPLCCGFTHHYHPLFSLLLLRQPIPQTDNLTCSAFHGACVLSPRARWPHRTVPGWQCPCMAL